MLLISGCLATKVWFNTIGPKNNQIYPMVDFFCSVNTKHQHSIGETLLGHKFIDSGMQILFLQNSSNYLCRISLNDSRSEFMDASRLNYVYQLFIDDLPVWGNIGPNYTHIYSGFDFIIEFNNLSIIRARLNQTRTVDLNSPFIDVSYSVKWIFTPDKYESRFTSSLDSDFFEHKIRWISIAFAFIVILLLSVALLIILARILRKDIARYDFEETNIELKEEYGWKLVHADVFRAPRNLTLFAALYGSGWQLALCALLLLIFTIVFMLYLKSGNILTCGIFLYALLSIISGFTSSRLYSKYDGHNLKRTMITTALLWPSVIFSVGFLANFISTSFGTSRAIGISTIFALFAIFVFIVLPLSFIGSIFGKSSNRGFPCRVNLIPRQIPTKKWYESKYFIIALSGLLQFLTVYVELSYIMASFWSYKFYYLYGFLLLMYIFLAIITCCVAILAAYFVLNSEDHEWPWTIFHSCGSLSFYIALYSIYYFLAISNMHGLFQFVMYLAYTLLFCFTIYCMLGAIGYSAALYFITKIYNNVKID